MGRVNTALQISDLGPFSLTRQDGDRRDDLLYYRTGDQIVFSHNALQPGGYHSGCRSLVVLYRRPHARSAARHLRLICFEASERSSSSCRFGDPVAPADPFEFAFSYDFYGDANFTVVGPLRRAELGRLGLHF